MAHTHIATYNTGYSQHTTAEGVTFVGEGVLSDTQGVSSIDRKNNRRHDTETERFGEDCHVNK